MDGIKKILPIFKSSLSGSVAGSLALHGVLIILYGLILIPENLNPPIPKKKFKIEMVKRNTSVPKKVRFKETKIKRPKEITPVKMSLPKAVSVKQTFQPVKINKSNIPPISSPRQMKQVNIQQKTSQRYKVSTIRMTSLKEQQPLSKPKHVTKSTTYEKRAMVAKTISLETHSVSIRTRPSTHLKNDAPKKRISYRGRVPLSSKHMPVLKPMSSAMESKAPSEKVMGIYETKAHPIANLPTIPFSKPTQSSYRTDEDAMRASLIQKGKAITLQVLPAPRPVPNIVDQLVLDKYLNSLQLLIASAKQYPESARKFGMEGKATVQFIVMSNGEVKDIQFISKTNYPILNEEAINAVKRAAPFSGFPDDIGKPFLEIVLPFRFKLN